ncbi:hypothetical protein KDA11_06930 [Candidatus Saccharibacteria bacterium]|nr:hypothetical protein [Candidatus Saccharibacteria bacterium]
MIILILFIYALARGGSSVVVPPKIPAPPVPSSVAAATPFETACPTSSSYRIGWGGQVTNKMTDANQYALVLRIQLPQSGGPCANGVSSATYYIAVPASGATGYINWATPNFTVVNGVDTSISESAPCPLYSYPSGQNIIINTGVAQLLSTGQYSTIYDPYSFQIPAALNIKDNNTTYLNLGALTIAPDSDGKSPTLSTIKPTVSNY